MVCGVNLGILVVCLVQVEYVRCLWETQGKGFKKPNANTYDPFTQNRLRQASFPSGFDQSLHQGLPGSSYSEAASELTQNGRSRVQYVKSHPSLQAPKGDVLQKWPLRGSEIAIEYGSPERTDFTAVRASPVQGSRGHRRHMSSGSALQSSRENYALRRPHMTPDDLKNKVQTSATVRGKLVRSSKKRTHNQKERFPFNTVQVDRHPSGPRLSKPQSYNSYSWGQPQSNVNQKTPNGQDASSSTVTYRVADKYGGSFIIRLRNQEHSEEVRPSETQMAFQGQMVPKSVWRKVKPRSNMTPLD